MHMEIITRNTNKESYLKKKKIKTTGKLFGGREKEEGT